MKFIFILVLGFGCAAAFGKNAPPDIGVIEVRRGHKLYVEHYPAQNGRPTIFVANGLTFSTNDYRNLTRSLKDLDPDVGIVLWDMVGMGETLLLDPPVRNRIPIEEQIRDLKDLKSALKINGPASLAGLSYGGAVTLKYSTLHPHDFDHFIAIAPMLERLPDQDMWIRHMARMHMIWASASPVPFAARFWQTVQQNLVSYIWTWCRAIAPDAGKSRQDLEEKIADLSATEWWRNALLSAGVPDPHNFDEVYDYYLRILIYATYWMAEPSVLENQYKLEGVFRMVQGVKDWNAMDAAKLYPKRKIHALVALQDEHVKIERADTFWRSVPEEARASYLRLNYSRHKITSEWPRVSAVWLLNILNNNPELQQGHVFEGDAVDKKAIHGNTVIPLDKVGFCETFLRTADQ